MSRKNAGVWIILPGGEEIGVRLERQDGFTVDGGCVAGRREDKESCRSPNHAGCLAESKLGEPEPHYVPFPGSPGRETETIYLKWVAGMVQQGWDVK
jgi:hypothetical protein